MKVIDQFIIEVSLVVPVSKIVNQLKGREFRDCDIKWLNDKLEKYSKFACQTLGITSVHIESNEATTLNDYVVEQYLKRFNTLLEYFKSL